MRNKKRPSSLLTKPAKLKNSIKIIEMPKRIIELGCDKEMFKLESTMNKWNFNFLIKEQILIFSLLVTHCHGVTPPLSLLLKETVDVISSASIYRVTCSNPNGTL